nr:uncharacterized PPE family protein PPE10-like [Chelonoidis abingdonii]
MKVSYVATFLIALLSLESTRAAPLKNNQFWSVGSGSVDTGNVGDGSFNDNSQNNQFWSVGSGSVQIGNVGNGQLNDNNQNKQFWAVCSGSVNSGNLGDGIFDISPT